MPFHVFLAVLEKTEAGGCMQGWDPRDQYGWGHQDSDEEEEDDDESFHSLDEIYDTNFSILKLVDLTGRSLGAGHSFGLEDVVQDEDAILPDEADEEDYEGYMGNSGPSATHFYRTSAVVLVPRDCLVSYLATGGRDTAISSLTEYFAELSVKLLDSDRGAALSMWTGFCKEIFSQRQKMMAVSTTKDTKGLVLLNTLRLKDWGLWDDIIASMAGAKHDLLDTFFEDVCEELLMSKITFDQVEKGITTLITLLPTLARQYEAVASFADFDAHEDIEISDEIRTVIEAWARQAFVHVLVEERPLGVGDGQAMVDLAFERFDLDWFKEQTVPIFRRNIRDFGFSLEYLAQFHIHLGATKGCCSEDAKALYKNLATSMIDVIDASLLHCRDGSTDPGTSITTILAGYGSYGGRNIAALQADLRNTVSHDILAGFIKGVLAEGLPLATVQKLLFKLTDQADRIDPAEFHLLWLPFLRSFFSILDKMSIPLTTPRYQQFSIAIFEGYLKRHVRKEPPLEVSDLRRPQVRCSCGDCSQLNRFLASGHERVGRFAMATKRREHLDRRLKEAGIDCQTTTECGRSPYTLVVTKTFTQHAKVRAAWRARAAEAKRQFGLFDQERLRIVLGPDFSKITELDSVRLMPIDNSHDVQTRQSHRNAQPPMPAPQQMAGPNQPLPQQPSYRARQPHHQSPGFPVQKHLFEVKQEQQHPQVFPPYPSSLPRPAPQPGQGPRLPGINEIGILSHSSGPQTVAGSATRPLAPIAGNQTHPRSKPVVKIESTGYQPSSLKQEAGKKRKASEIEVIDLTGFD